MRLYPEFILVANILFALLVPKKYDKIPITFELTLAAADLRRCCNRLRQYDIKNTASEIPTAHVANFVAFRRSSKYLCFRSLSSHVLFVFEALLLVTSSSELLMTVGGLLGGVRMVNKEKGDLSKSTILISCSVSSFDVDNIVVSGLSRVQSVYIIVFAPAAFPI